MNIIKNFCRSLHRHRFIRWNLLPFDIKCTILAYAVKNSYELTTVIKSIRNNALVCREFYAIYKHKNTWKEIHQMSCMRWPVFEIKKYSDMNLIGCWNSYLIVQQTNKQVLINENGAEILQCDRIATTMKYLVCVTGSNAVIYYRDVDSSCIVHSGPLISMFSNVYDTTAGLLLCSQPHNRIYTLPEHGHEVVRQLCTLSDPICAITFCGLYCHSKDRIIFIYWRDLERDRYIDCCDKSSTPFTNIVSVSTCGSADFIFTGEQLIAYNPEEQRILWRIQMSSSPYMIITNDVILLNGLSVLDLSTGTVVYRDRCSKIAALIRTDKYVLYCKN